MNCNECKTKNKPNHIFCNKCFEKVMSDQFKTGYIFGQEEIYLKAFMYGFNKAVNLIIFKKITRPTELAEIMIKQKPLIEDIIR